MEKMKQILLNESEYKHSYIFFKVVVLNDTKLVGSEWLKQMIISTPFAF